MNIFLGDKIRALRESKGLSTQAFAHLLGFSPGMVNGVEKGKMIPGGAFLVQLNAVFGVSIDYMLGIKKPGSITLSAEETRLIEAFRELNESDQGHQLATIESIADKERLLREKDGLVGALENLSGDASAGKRNSEKATVERARKKKIADASDPS